MVERGLFASRIGIFAGALMAVTAAHAGGVTPTVMLPGAVSYEYIGLNYADNVATSTAVGVLDYTGLPGCGGVCTATTALGADPSVGIQMNEVEYMGGGGGYSTAALSFYVEYVPLGPPSPPDTLFSVDLHADDVFSSNFASYGEYVADAQAYIAVGVAGNAPGELNNFQSYTFQDTDCVNGCQQGIANYLNPQPFLANQPLQILADTPYLVAMQVYLYAGDTGVPLTASIDPTFSSPSGGTFVYSPGVTAGVPEPATWALMLTALGALGATIRRRRAMAGVLAV